MLSNGALTLVIKGQGHWLGSRSSAKLCSKCMKLALKIIFGELFILGYSTIPLYILYRVWAIEWCLDLDDQRSRSLAKVKVIDKNLARNA